MRKARRASFAEGAELVHELRGQLRPLFGDHARAQRDHRYHQLGVAGHLGALECDQGVLLGSVGVAASEI